MKNSIAAEKGFFFSMTRSTASCLIFFAINRFVLNISAFSLKSALFMTLLSTVSPLLGIMVLSRGKISVYTLFMMLGGMMIPFLAGVIFWDEILSALRILGLILMTVSLCIPVLEKKGGQDTKNTKNSFRLRHVL